MVKHKVVTVNMNKLVEELVQIRGASFVTFDSITDPRLKKTGLPEYLQGVKKYNTVNAMLNFLYEPAVVKKLLKEGKNPDVFRRGTNWYEPIFHDDGTITPIVRNLSGHDSEFYLRVMVLNEFNTHYKTAAGLIIDSNEIAEFLPVGASYINQGLDDPVVVKTYALENIKNIRMNNKQYEINS